MAKDDFKDSIRPHIRGLLNGLVSVYKIQIESEKDKIKTKPITSVCPKLEKGLEEATFTIEPTAKIMDVSCFKSICVLECSRLGSEYSNSFANKVTFLRDLNLLNQLGIERFLRGNVRINFDGKTCNVAYSTAVLNFEDDTKKSYGLRADAIIRADKSTPSLRTYHFVIKPGDLEKTSKKIARLVAAGTPELADRL